MHLCQESKLSAALTRFELMFPGPKPDVVDRYTTGQSIEIKSHYKRNFSGL